MGYNDKSGELDFLISEAAAEKNNGALKGLQLLTLQPNTLIKPKVN